MHVKRYQPTVVDTHYVLFFTWDGETPFKAADVLKAVFKDIDIPLKDGLPAECIISGEGMSKSNRDQWTFLIDWFHSPIPEFVNVWIQDINGDVQADLQRRQL